MQMMNCDVWMFEFTYDPSNVATITTVEDSITVPGLRVGDAVFVNKQTHETGLGVVNARVSANDTLAITLMNPTAGGINEASETWRGVVFRGALPLPTNAIF